MKYLYLILLTFNVNLSANENVDNKTEITNEQIAVFINNSNSSLPMKLDEFSRADKVALKGNDIYFYYTFTQWTNGQLDKELFKKIQLPTLVEDSCNSESKIYLKAGRKLVYVYSDKNNEFFSEFTVNPSDCDRLHDAK